MLPSKIGTFVPVGSVKKSALVLVQTWYRRPPPVVKNSARIDQDITVLGYLGVVLQILDLHIVATLLVIPICSIHLVLCLDKSVEMVLPCERIEVVKDFLTTSIYGRPVKLGFERPCVVVGWDIACAAVFDQPDSLVRMISMCPLTYPGYLFSYQVPETSWFFS